MYYYLLLLHDSRFFSVLTRGLNFWKIDVPQFSADNFHSNFYQIVASEKIKAYRKDVLARSGKVSFEPKFATKCTVLPMY